MGLTYSGLTCDSLIRVDQLAKCLGIGIMPVLTFVLLVFFRDPILKEISFKFFFFFSNTNVCVYIYIYLYIFVLLTS